MKDTITISRKQFDSMTDEINDLDRQINLRFRAENAINEAKKILLTLLHNPAAYQ